MKELISYQTNLLNQEISRWYRYLYPVLQQESRLIGIKGLRGVGKTTMFLQYLKYEYSGSNEAMYVTADHPYFYNNTLFNLASEWNKYGGKLLLVDEVHKYPAWSRELKLIYDGFPDIRVIFTSSSALDLYRGESDLSRRLITYTLHGLSFREYLSLEHNVHIEKYSLSEIIAHHRKLSREITGQLKVIPAFKRYLESGYFPFRHGIDQESFGPRLLQIINTVLENDLSWIEGYSPANIIKIRKILGVIAESVPFQPNISKIAERIQLGRNTLNIYLKNLHDAGILHLLRKPGKGLSQLQKPDKIYFENPSFSFAFQNEPNIGTIREVFFINQIRNSGHEIYMSPGKGDFLVNDQYLFETGGKNKNSDQIKGLKNSFLALDDIEHGFAGTIPLWLFGFLY